MAEAFVGSFQLISSEKFEEYLAALGCFGANTRRLSRKPTVVNSVDADGTWTFQTITEWRARRKTHCSTTEIKFKLNEEFEEISFGGRKVKSLITLEDGKLVQKQKAQKPGDKDTEIIREINGKKLVVTMALDDIVCIRTYQR